MTGLPLLEKHRVQVRLIFSLLTLPTPEPHAGERSGAACRGGLGCEGAYTGPAHALHPWPRGCLCSLLPARSRVLFTVLELSDNSWPLGEVECCFPSCSLCRGQGDLEGSVLYPAWSGLGRKAT